MVVRQKANLEQDLAIVKVHTNFLKKTGKYHINVFIPSCVQQSHNEIDAWQFALTEICETYDQCKEREHLSNTGIKHLTPVGFMKRKNIYIKSSFLTFL